MILQESHVRAVLCAHMLISKLFGINCEKLIKIAESHRTAEKRINNTNTPNFVKCWLCCGAYQYCPSTPLDASQPMQTVR